MAPASTRTSGAPTRALVVCLLAALAMVAGPTPAAQAWSEGACAEGEGVTVVVDFRSLGGDTIVRCAPAPVESGYDALTRAGLDWTPTQRQPGFLCRIEGVPADDPCVQPAPADAYWSYWRAEPGGDWRYSNYGPAATNPPPGPVEGWSYSTGSENQPPRTAPPASAAPEPPPPSPSPTAEPDPDPEPEPAPTPPPTEQPAPAPTSTPQDGPASPEPATADEQPPEPSRSPSPSPTPRASPSPTPPPTPTPTPPPTPTPTATDRATTAATEAGGDGFPLGTLAGIVLVLGVGGGAVVADRRRRRP